MLLQGYGFDDKDKWLVTPKYKVLIDESGFNTDTYQDQLKEKAAQLSAILPAIYKDSFMVLSAGFYLNHFNIKSGISEQLEYLKTKAVQTSKYYLLYAKQTDSSGIYTQFYIDMKLPKSGVFSCMDDAQRNVLLSRIETALNASYNTNKRSFLKYNLAEMAGMDVLKAGITKTTKCCGDNTSDCTFNEDEIMESLYAAGFSEILDQKIFRLAPVTNPNPNFETQYNLTFLNEEDTTKTYNYTTKLKEILTQYAADGTVKAKLSYYNNSNATTFKDFKPLKLDTRIFITEIVVVNLKGKNRVFVYLERNHSANSTRGVVDFQNMEDYFIINKNVCKLTESNSQLRKWLTSGHLQTVYVLARTMGISDVNARVLGCHAEYYDHNCDPLTLVLTPHLSNTGIPYSGTWADRWSQNHWHSLTGGLQENVREEVINRILGIGVVPLPDPYLIGKPKMDLDQLHTLGDSWAHSYIVNGKRYCYGGEKVSKEVSDAIYLMTMKTLRIPVGWTWEHAFSFAHDGGLDLDKIYNRNDVYFQYLNDLIYIFNHENFKYHNEVKFNMPDVSFYKLFFTKKDNKYIVDDKMIDFLFEKRIEMENSITQYKKLEDNQFYLLSTFLTWKTIKFETIPRVGWGGYAFYDIEIKETKDDFYSKLH